MKGRVLRPRVVCRGHGLEASENPMNKRKKLIRTVTEKTGVSHAGAANLLDRGKPKFVRKPFKIESLFLREEISEDSIPIYLPQEFG